LVVVLDFTEAFVVPLIMSYCCVKKLSRQVDYAFPVYSLNKTQMCSRCATTLFFKTELADCHDATF
jgi:hypothetical protein